jgi:hypothetical protein
VTVTVSAQIFIEDDMQVIAPQHFLRLFLIGIFGKMDKIGAAERVLVPQIKMVSVIKKFIF